MADGWYISLARSAGGKDDQGRDGKVREGWEQAENPQANEKNNPKAITSTKTKSPSTYHF